MHHPWIVGLLAWLGVSWLPLSAVNTDYIYIITAVSPIIASFGGVYLAWKLRAVKHLVNEAATTSAARIDQLANALTAAGIDVPATTPKTGGA